MDASSESEVVDRQVDLPQPGPLAADEAGIVSESAGEPNTPPSGDERLEVGSPVETPDALSDRSEPGHQRATDEGYAVAPAKSAPSVAAETIDESQTPSIELTDRNLSTPSEPGDPGQPTPGLVEQEAEVTNGVPVMADASTPVAVVDPELDQDVAPDGEPQDASDETPARPIIGTLPPPPETRVMVIANQKGGVGKTTTAVNIAAALAMGGLSVLVIDLDPQGNASTALGVEHGAGTKGTYEVLLDGEPIEGLTVESPEAPNLKVLPATVDLAASEVELVSMVARESRLHKALRAYLKDHPVDYVFFDCPPSLGLLTLNAFVAATEIMIPIQCEYYALEGVSQLMQTINLVKAELNDDLELSTVLLTMFDARTKLAAQVVDEVRTHFADQTLPMVIPRSVRISEAPSYGQTVLTYQPESTGAASYLSAATEIAHRGAKENS